jgi:hypothetical protein
LIVHKRAGKYGAFLFFAALAATAAADRLVTRGANISADVSRADGRIVMDLDGSIWILPASGGGAVLASNGLLQASRPRWSPDGRKILFQTASGEGTGLWMLDVETLQSSSISDASLNNQFASFHPQGERIIYSSGRNDLDFDLWETDLSTGLSWRLTSDPGDEIEAVWSASGRDLAYLHKRDDHYAIVVRRRGNVATEVFVSVEPLSSLSWRPDGTLLTFLHGSADQKKLEMVILADPPLIREFARGEDYFPFPVSWRDRTQHIYTADGMIKKRAFGDLRSKPLPFTALIKNQEVRPRRKIVQRQLPVITPSREQLVIRGARLFDGIWHGYRDDIDVLIDGGKIVAVLPRQDWPGVTVLDLGAVTILPGFIDSWSSIPADPQQIAGAKLLAYGVTSIVSDQVPGKFDAALWEGADMPGPRLLPAVNLVAGNAPEASAAFYLASIGSQQNPESDVPAPIRAWQDLGIPILADNWKTHRSYNADLLLGVESLPRVWFDDRYQEEPGAGHFVAANNASVVVVSGLADAATPGLSALLASRQAREFHQVTTSARRYSEPQQLRDSSASILVGSKPNGLPPGLALHAELRAISAAGLTGEQVFHAAGKNPAMIFGLENQIGTITPGALADLVLVNGDPLNKVNDALDIVAVVRNGRFYSLIRLLEQAEATADVE